MTKREKDKARTRERILLKTKEEICGAGIINLKTIDIANSAGVSHGSLFAHFGNKEELVGAAIEMELKRIAIELNDLVGTSVSFEELLESFLNFVAAEEDLFSVIATEIPFVNERLRRAILGLEVLIRNVFHKKLVEGIEAGEFKDINPTSTLTFLFGTISFFLSRRKMFSQSGNVISERKNQIINTFLSLIEEDK